MSQENEKVTLDQKSDMVSEGGPVPSVARAKPADGGCELDPQNTGDADADAARQIERALASISGLNLTQISVSCRDGNVTALAHVFHPERPWKAPDVELRNDDPGIH